MDMSPAPAIPSQGPSLFEVVARRALERPPRALLDREFVQAFNDALSGDGAKRDPGGEPAARPAVDVRV
jgi:hypothetical protein